MWSAQLRTKLLQQERFGQYVVLSFFRELVELFQEIRVKCYLPTHTRI